MLLLTVFLVAVGATGAFQPPLALTTKRYDGYKVLSVIPSSDDALAVLHHLMLTDMSIDFWKEPSTVGSEAHMMVSPEDLPRVQRILDDSSVVYATHIEDVQSLLTPMWNSIDSRFMKPEQQAFDLNDFNRVDDIFAWLEGLKCRSGLTCKLYSIGSSYEGRPIYVFKISKSGAGRKAYWIDSTHHAREWISTATTLQVLNNLATGGDMEAVRLTDTYDWYIVPVVNPDGYSYSWTNDRMWRKNRNVNKGSVCYGTDLNRNYDSKWGTDGVSHLPCSETYCGSSAGSEPETAAMQSEMVRVGASLGAMITVHSYGKYWMFPYGHTVGNLGKVCQRADDHEQLMAVADVTADAIENTYNTKWTRGNSCEAIYPTSGGTDDFAKAVAGIKYSFCAELRGNSFIISKENIPLSFNEFWNGLVAMCNVIDA